MRISYSGLDTYQSCPLKYKFREIDHLPEPKSKEAVFGTLIHATLRYIHEPSPLPVTLEGALNFYSQHWNEEIYTDEQEERAAFAQGVQMIQNYFHINDPSKFIIVDLESRFSLEVGDDQTGKHVLTGVIDRIDKTPEGYEIIDYKTSRKMPSQEKVDRDLQLSIYLKAFLNRYPHEAKNLDRITVSLYYLKHGVKLSSKRTREQLEALDQVILSVLGEIEAGHFDPLLSPLCDWCGFQKHCPLWRHKFAEERKLDSDAVKGAIHEFIDLRNQLAAEKLRLARLQETILQYMEQEKVERVFDPGGIIGKVFRKTYDYNEAELRSILEPLDKWEDVLKVDGIALKNVLSTLPSALKEQAEKAKILKRESASLSVKKNKDLDEVSE